MPHLFFAPFVIAMRLPKLALEAASLAAGRKPRTNERARMIGEKMAAANEGLLMTWLEGAQIALDLGLKAARGDSAGAMRVAARAPQRLGEAAVAPARQRVKRNLRRLRAGR